MMELVPYSDGDAFSSMTEYPLPASVPVLTHPGQVRGVYITLHPDTVNEAATRFERWFATRSEVKIVDVGTSDKAGLGFVLIEWLETDIDQLFLAILNDEQAVADYTLYGRNLEEYNNGR